MSASSAGARPRALEGPGSYVLLLRSPRAREVAVGRLGRLGLRRGHYLYVGSALGSGGLRARLGHHLRPASRPHWHLDHLRPHLEVLGAFVVWGRARVEHRIAAQLEEWLPEAPGLAGFGSSDCRCRRHLFYSQDRPSVPGLRGRLLRHAGLVYVGWRSAATLRHTRDAWT
ncbi:MAG: DUF123 domain-containing protein [Myxococcota bacterium]